MNDTFLSRKESQYPERDEVTQTPDDKIACPGGPPLQTRRTTGFDRWIVREILKRIGNPRIDVRLWDNRPLLHPDASGEAEILICDRATLWKLVLSPEYQFAEAYSQGRILIRGDLVDLSERLYKDFPETGWWRRIRWRGHMSRAHSLSASRRNVHQHYDLGNDFYRLWLDEQLLYTCAYFPNPDMSLEAAQVAKMDHVCRKLRLKPGQHVIEAGCGWGSLALHMAKKYQVTVRAYNLSCEQISYAREAAGLASLSDRVEFVEDDWRNITGTCDAFVSVGMLEHVGVENYSHLGDVIHRCLKTPGLALIHSIGKNVAEPLSLWIEHRIFPGAEPPSLKQMMKIFERRRYSVLDVENLRLHYAQTLRHWLQRFEQNIETVRQLYGEEFVRTWRLYLAGSVAAFTCGSLQLFQILFSQSDNNQIPWSRKSLYLPESAAAEPEHFPSEPST